MVPLAGDRVWTDFRQGADADERPHRGNPAAMPRNEE